jgi:hypothetical protein
VIQPLLGPTARRCPIGTRATFSYTWRNAHFIALDIDGGSDPTGSRDSRLSPEEVAWLAADVARAKEGGCDWVFLVTHPPFFSLMGPVGDAYIGHGDDVANATALEPVFARGVDVVISGHSHQYYRTFPMPPGDHRDPRPRTLETEDRTSWGRRSS